MTEMEEAMSGGEFSQVQPGQHLWLRLINGLADMLCYYTSVTLEGPSLPSSSLSRAYPARCCPSPFLLPPQASRSFPFLRGCTPVLDTRGFAQFLLGYAAVASVSSVPATKLVRGGCAVNSQMGALPSGQGPSWPSGS